jgi:hypothetical protein
MGNKVKSQIPMNKFYRMKDVHYVVSIFLLLQFHIER